MKRASFVVAFVLVACSSEDPAVTPTPDASVPIERPDAAPPPPPPVDAGPEDSGVPLDVPESLVTALTVKPYVEGTCESTTYAGWPHAAKKCTYRPEKLVVTVANPEPEQVARWIVEASTQIPALDALKTTDRESWEAGLVAIAKHTLGQSSRIFPLDGQVWENGTVYRFERGVTKTCKSGCYCRINSTSRQQWCAYAVTVLKTETSESACLEKYGQTTSTLTEPWLAHCLENHEASWTSDSNEHYRAQAWNANKAIVAKLADAGSPTGADVVAAIKAAYP